MDVAHEEVWLWTECDNGRKAEYLRVYAVGMVVW